MTPIGIPVAVLTRARRAADAFEKLTGVETDTTELLTGRAALLGLSPQGRISAGGATHLMRSSDGWCALTLSRPDDVDAVPALIESDADDPWPAVERWMAQRASADITTTNSTAYRPNSVAVVPAGGTGLYLRRAHEERHSVLPPSTWAGALLAAQGYAGDVASGKVDY